MTREEHLKAIYITSTRKVGKNTLLVMLCSGPDCGGSEMLAHFTVGGVLAEATAHIDKMDRLAASTS
jgi:hypothetical protein